MKTYLQLFHYSFTAGITQVTVEFADSKNMKKKITSSSSIYLSPGSNSRYLRSVTQKKGITETQCVNGSNKVTSQNLVSRGSTDKTITSLNCNKIVSQIATAPGAPCKVIGSTGNRMAWEHGLKCKAAAAAEWIHHYLTHWIQEADGFNFLPWLLSCVWVLSCLGLK